MKSNGTTRKTFLGTLGVALLAPALKSNAAAAGRKQGPSTGRPDVIRQAELQRILDNLARADSPMLGFRRRLLAGATVEPGNLSLEFCGSAPDGNPEEWSSTVSYGLLLDRR